MSLEKGPSGTLLVANKDNMNTSVATSDVASGDLISDETARIITSIEYGLCEVVAVFGTVANILNLICFAKLDLKDAINVSFLALAISDLGGVILMFWTSLCMIPSFAELDFPFDPIDMQILVSGFPHILFTRVTSWITALVTMERCLCITMPLKVKSIITSKRVVILIAFIFILITAGVSPIYYCSRLAWVFSIEKNKTMLKVVYTDDRLIVEQIGHGITNIFVPFSAYVAVVVSTIVLVVKLREKSKWRLKSTMSANADTMSNRDQKVSKMVVMISSLFIACFVPLCFIFIAMITEPRLSFGGQYKNTLYILGGTGMLLEGTNSALNIFIYYRMSSKYRVVFRQLFRLKTTE